jgi:hypothetical protein
MDYLTKQYIFVVERNRPRLNKNGKPKSKSLAAVN